MIRRINVCLSCGACRAHFRASFFYRETDEFIPGGVGSDDDRPDGFPLRPAA